MKTNKLSIVSLMLCSLVYAQSGGNYSLNKSTIASGGGQSSGGDFTLNGTMGQVDASNSISGGDFSLAGGFWSSTINSDIIYKNGFE